MIYDDMIVGDCPSSSEFRVPSSEFRKRGENLLGTLSPLAPRSLLVPNIPSRMTVLASRMIVLASFTILVRSLMMLYTITHSTMKQMSCRMAA